MREKDVESYLVKKMESLGLCCVKFIPDGKIGMPDRLLLLPNGKVIWVEMKAPNGRLSEVQKVRHHQLINHGQQVEVIWDKQGVDALADRLEDKG